ncbi:hypothetical protein SCH4B_3060 [Ruegeria sp. TrichCH4B]|nr:hypothetical protein SCH4B_3060 [Ruegeria sp. TrichCH4B]
MQYDLPFAIATGAVDWDLLISYGATLALLPFQLTYLAKFVISRKGFMTG